MNKITIEAAACSIPKSLGSHFLAGKTGREIDAENILNDQLNKMEPLHGNQISGSDERTQ